MKQSSIEVNPVEVIMDPALLIKYEADKLEKYQENYGLLEGVLQKGFQYKTGNIC